MSREADYDVDLFAEMVRSGAPVDRKKIHALTEPEKGSAKSKPRKTSRS